MPRSVTLIDKDGATWVRHLCRSCRNVVLWAVLGEPVPMCEGCRREHCRLDPMGTNRVDRMAPDVFRQESQYHGDRWYTDL